MLKFVFVIRYFFLLFVLALAWMVYFCLKKDIMNLFLEFGYTKKSGALWCLTYPVKLGRFYISIGIHSFKKKTKHFSLRSKWFELRNNLLPLNNLNGALLIVDITLLPPPLCNMSFLPWQNFIFCWTSLFAWSDKVQRRGRSRDETTPRGPRWLKQGVS